jgi:hypothetical protein
VCLRCIPTPAIEISIERVCMGFPEEGGGFRRLSGLVTLHTSWLSVACEPLIGSAIDPFMRTVDVVSFAKRLLVGAILGEPVRWPMQRGRVVK